MQTTATKKELYAEFERALIKATAGWRDHRVSQYNSAYSTAFSQVSNVLNAREKQLVAERELALFVANLAGAAILAWAPPAAALFAGRGVSLTRNSQGVVQMVANTSGITKFVIKPETARGLLLEFATDRAKDVRNAITSEVQKKAIEKLVGSAAKATLDSAVKSPTDQKNFLEQALGAMKSMIDRSVIAVYNKQSVSDASFAQYLTTVYESPFFQQCPETWPFDHPLGSKAHIPERISTGVSIRFEKLMWAYWILALQNSGLVVETPKLSGSRLSKKCLTSGNRPQGRMSHNPQKIGYDVAKRLKSLGIVARTDFATMPYLHGWAKNLIKSDPGAGQIKK